MNDAALDFLTTEAQKAVASGIPVDELLTPLVKGTNERLYMHVVNASSIPRGPGFKGCFTDKRTGREYNAWGKECGLPACFCDLEVEEISR